MSHKLVKDTDEAFTIQHPDGSTFQVAKHGLSKSLLEKIRSIEPVKMFEGGVTPDEPQLAPDIQNLNQRAEYEQAQNPGLSLGDAVARVAMQDAPPVEPPLIPGERFADRRARLEAEPSYEDKLAADKLAMSQAAPVPSPTVQGPRVPASAEQAAAAAGATPAATPAPAPTLTSQLAGDFAMQKRANELGYQAKAKESQAIANAYKTNEVENQYIQNNYVRQKEDLDREGAKIKASMAEDVNPTRFWDSKSTGNKVSTAIGILLGGIGQGLLKSNSNVVMDMVNKQVEQDIEAQKADLGKRHTLLSANLQKYGNLEQATTATRLQSNQALQAQIARAAAENGSESAKAAAMAANGVLGQNEHMLSAQLLGAQAKALEEKKPLAIPQLGPGVYAQSPTVADKINTSIVESNKATNGISELLKIGDIPGSSITPALRERAASTALLLQGALRTPVLGPGNVNDAERELLVDIIRNPTAIFSISANNKVRLQTLLDRVVANQNEQLRAYGLPQTYGLGKFKVSAPVGS